MAFTGDDRILDGTFLVRLEKLQLTSKRLFRGRQRAERRSKNTGASLEFADYREFVSGDDLRNVDWSVYGRSDRLYLKLFEEEEDIDVHVLLDASASMAWKPAGGLSKLDWGKRTAAALSYIALSHLDRVCVHSFAAELGQNAGLRRGKQQFHIVLSFLRQLNESQEPTSLLATVRGFVAQVRRAGMVILLSDLLDPEGFEGGLNLLRHHGFDVHVVQLLDASEVEPEAEGDLRIVDAESGVELDVNAGASALAMYRDALQQWLGQIESYCARGGIGFVRETTDGDFDRFVLQILRKARLIG